jgi:hypothetical protein
MTRLDVPENGEADDPGPGYIFIENAIKRIKERLRIPDGRAQKELLDAIRSGEFRTRKTYWDGFRRRDRALSYTDWKGAYFRVDEFEESGRGGIYFGGRCLHLHRFLVDEPDFCSWLDARGQRCARRTDPADKREADADTRLPRAPIPAPAGLTLPNKRGPPDKKRLAATEAMVRAVSGGDISLEQLCRRPEKTLGEFYKDAKRTTLREARKDAVTQLQEQREPRQNSDKTPTNDK